MSCDQTSGDCSPCKDCGDPVPPVMPRCNDPLPIDGVFTNATVTVVNGCIVDVSQGTPYAYTPDPCCDAGTPGADGLDGDQGPPGIAASVSIGTVTSAPAGTPAQVINVGTTTAAILDFILPRGADGSDAELPAGGLDYSDCDFDIANGQIRGVPGSWPPVLEITTATSPATAILTAVKTCSTYALTLDLTQFRLGIMSDVQTMIDDQVGANIQARVTTLEGQVLNLQTSNASLTARVGALEVLSTAQGGTIANQQNQINSQQTQITNLQLQVADLIGRMGTAEGNITTIQNTCCP